MPVPHGKAEALHPLPTHWLRVLSLAQNPLSLSLCPPCWGLEPVSWVLMATEAEGKWLFLSGGQLSPCRAVLLSDVVDDKAPALCWRNTLKEVVFRAGRVALHGQCQAALLSTCSC